MRMRKKAWARPELDICPFFIKNPEEYRGNWHSHFLKEQPVWLELGCGKSPFLAQMGLLHPEINFIGVDISLDILGVARRNISSAYQQAGKEVDNILLSAFNIERIDTIMSSADQVERIYINFCNPWPKKKHQKRRLTYPGLLDKYKEFLAEDGEIWLKTDDDGLFDDSLLYFQDRGFTLLRKTRDLHRETDWPENIQTEHELMFSSQGIPIKGAIYRKS